MFKKNLLMEYSTVLWKSSRPGPAQSSQLELPLPYRSIRNPGFLCLTPKRVIKFSKCLESRQDSAMQSGSPITNLLCSPTVVIFWPRHVVCGILVPQPGIKPVLPALEVQSLNLWTVREVPLSAFKKMNE